MTKTEFLDKLKIALTGKVSAVLVEENMTYYNEYIDSQIQMGKSEWEVMNMLGDPRLIARTIVQTNGITSDEPEEADYRESGYSRDNGEYSQQNHQVKVRSMPGWLLALIMILIVVCVLSFVFSLVSALLPFVLPVLIVLFFVKLFRDWLN